MTAKPAPGSGESETMLADSDAQHLTSPGAVARHGRVYVSRAGTGEETGYAHRSLLIRRLRIVTRGHFALQNASEQEKLLITATYYYRVTGEIEDAVRAYEEMVESYPQASEK